MARAIRQKLDPNSRRTRRDSRQIDTRGIYRAKGTTAKIRRGPDVNITIHTGRAGWCGGRVGAYGLAKIGCETEVVKRGCSVQAKIEVAQGVVNHRVSGTQDARRNIKKVR